MENKKIIAIFDFCDTLIKGQTISLFFQFLDRYEKNLLKRICIKIKKLLGRIKYKKSLDYKNYLLSLYTFKNLEEVNNLAKRFVFEVLIPRENKKVIRELLNHKNNKHFICIASNAFDIYLKYYAEKYSIDYLVSTKLDFKNNKLCISGKECGGINKLNAIKEVVPLKEYDLQNSFAYSDSPQDIPILNIVGNAYIVNNGQALDWVKKNWYILNIEESD